MVNRAPRFDRQELLNDFFRTADTLFQKRRALLASVSTDEQLDRYREGIRRAFQAGIGPFPERNPLNVRITRSVCGPGYRVFTIVYTSRDHFYVTANVYAPPDSESESAELPGVLIPCGHTPEGKASTYHQLMGIELARNGFCALCYDPLGQGERYQVLRRDTGRPVSENAVDEHFTYGMQALLTGSHLANFMVWDAIRGLDALCTMPWVDPARLAVCGYSGGGMMSTFIAALDDRIRVAAPACFVSTIPHRIKAGLSSDPEQVPLGALAEGVDYTDLLATFAPKPLLICSPVEDFVPISGARAAFREVQSLYSRLGRSERVAMAECPGGHRWADELRRATIAWLARWLRHDTPTRLATDADLLPADRLACTETGNVNTSLGSTPIQHHLKERARLLKGARTAVADPEVRRLRIAERLWLHRFPQRSRGWITLDDSQGDFGDNRASDCPTLGVFTAPGIGSVPICVGPRAFHPEEAAPKRIALILVDGARREELTGATAVGLAGQGYLPIAATLPGVGDTAPTFPRGAQPEMVHRCLTHFSYYVGQTPVGRRVAIILAFVDAMERLGAEEVFVAAQGQLSGVPALHAAALDVRITYTRIQTPLSSFEAAVTAQTYDLCIENVVPNALADYDLPDLISLIRPRGIDVTMDRRVSVGDVEAS